MRFIESLAGLLGKASRKGAKDNENKQMTAYSELGCPAFNSKNTLRLSAFA
jgi:hypothetical protein